MNSFKEKAEEVVKLLQEYYKNEDGWTVCKKTKDGTTISYRTSQEFPNGYLYKGESVINAPPSTVFYYVDPLPDGPRAKWDSNMKKIEVLEWLEKMTYKYPSFTNLPRQVMCITNQKEHNLKESRLMLFSMEKNAHLALPLSVLPHRFGSGSNNFLCLGQTLLHEKPLLRINRACTASACMGLISPRDFVDVIITRETDEGISTNGVSVQYSGCPEEKKYVRGTNHPCGLLCNKIPGDPNKTKLVSLIQPDIGGMLPRTLADTAIPGSMTEFFSELKEALKNDGKLSS